MNWYQQTSPDAEIQFLGRKEYPIATMLKPHNERERLQIIPEAGEWTPVILDGTTYRKARDYEITREVQDVIAWCYDFTLGIGGVPTDVIGVEGTKQEAAT